MDGRVASPEFLAESTPVAQVRLLQSKAVLSLLYQMAQVMLIPEFFGVTNPAAGATTVDTSWRARRAVRTIVTAAVAGDVDVAESGAATDPAQANALLNPYAGEVIVNFRVNGSATLSLTPAGDGTVLSGTGTNRLRVLTTSNGEFDLRVTDAVDEDVRVTFDVEDRPSLDIRYLDVRFGP